MRYSADLARRLCDRLADGRPLGDVCADPDMPPLATVRRWIAGRPAFRRQYREARARQVEHFIDEIVEIADSEDNPARARVRIEARKLALARIAPAGADDPGEDAPHARDDLAARLERARRRIGDDGNDQP